MSAINLDASGRVYSFPTLFPGSLTLKTTPPPPPPGVREGGKIRDPGNEVNSFQACFGGEGAGAGELDWEDGKAPAGY